jgi:hypothetical protein
MEAHMAIDPAIFTDNATERRRLEALVARLSDVELGKDLGDGWTPAVALAHLAFWDRRAVLTLERWQRAGTLPDEPDVEILNDSLLEEWRALPPRRAADLAVAAARAADQTVEGLAAPVADAILARGEEWRLRRAVHRREHVDQIERALRS